MTASSVVCEEGFRSMFAIRDQNPGVLTVDA